MSDSSDKLVRHYRPDNAAVFFKTKEKNGGLSNMAAGFPILIGTTKIRTSEALYQSLRYPHLLDAQREIISEVSPMTAKMKAKKYKNQTRADWLEIRVPLMRWCIKAKLIQNFTSFSAVLEATGDLPIVEKKIRREDFWGAKIQEDGSFLGRNVLGRLLMQLRQQLRDGEVTESTVLSPLPIREFYFLGNPIGSIQAVQQETRRLI